MPTYTKLEYIEGTGTQYIDLGFKLSSNHSVDLDLQMIKINANIFGSRAGGQDRAFTLFANGSSILTDIGGTRNSTTATTDRINVYLSSSRIKIGTFERNISTYSFTTPGNGYIFNISYNRPQSYMASMKLYGCKIYLSGTLIRDLIPCKYNNQIGLWDTINGSFLGNAGTGEFIAGPEQGEVTIKYTELKYIESTGTQYINTKTYPTSTSFKAEIQYQYTRTTGPGSNKEAWVFGIWNGNSGWRCGCSGTSLNNVGSGFTFDNTLSTNKTIATSNACTATSSSYQVVLFGQGESGGPGHVSDALFRIYYCKRWNGNELVRDFIPCEYNDKIGLWDKISETFFANNGTGEFVAGPTIGPKTLKVKIIDKNNLFSKTVSKINGKYAKTINGVLVQCWKKKYE